MKQLILIKYGELTTKKGNRNLFINVLKNNIKKILKDYEISIRKDYSRMYLEVDEIYLDDITKKLQKVFGIHGIVICYRVNNNVEEIKNKALNLLNNSLYRTFKVQTKRADKTFPIRSMEFNNIGGFILKNTNFKVDVHQPDVI